MNPTAQIAQPKAQPLDPQVVALAQAIRQTESGGNFNAKGASGESGAYQWTPATWQAHAQQALGNPNAPMTPSNQNAVAYTIIKQDKDSGLNPAQIAAKWNSGSPTGWENKIGTNSMGVAYNVPQYVKSVTDAYQQFKAGNNNPTITPNASTVPQQSQQPQAPSVGGFLGNVLSSAGNVASGVASAVMHPINTAQNLEQIAEGGFTKLLGKPADQSTQAFDNTVSYFKNRYGGDNVSQVAHNIVQTAYKDPIGVALDLSTLLDGVGAGVSAAGKIGEASKIGELADVSNAASKVGNVLSSAGSAVNPISQAANVVGKAGDALTSVTDKLPGRIVNRFLPQLKDPATIDYAVQNVKLGKPETMLEESQKALDSYDNQIQAVLTHPDYQGVPVSGQTIINNTLGQFPNSEYTPEYIITKMKSQVPAQAATITKLEKGTISLDEANNLRQAVDRITYKNIIDSPEVKAGKDIAEAFGNSLRSQVQTLASETAPIFSNFSKEINLYKALEKLALKENKKSFVSLKDLMTFGAGNTVAGIPGAVIAGGIEKAAESPRINFAAAKLIKGAVTPAVKGAVNTGKNIVSKTQDVARAGYYANQNQK